MADVEEKIKKIGRILPPADSCHDYRGDTRGNNNIDHILDDVFKRNVGKIVSNNESYDVTGDDVAGNFMATYFKTRAHASFEPDFGKELEDKYPEVIKPIQAVYTIKDNYTSYEQELIPFVGYETLQIVLENSPSSDNELNYLGNFIANFMTSNEDEPYKKYNTNILQIFEIVTMLFVISKPEFTILIFYNVVFSMHFPILCYTFLFTIR